MREGGSRSNPTIKSPHGKVRVLCKEAIEIETSVKTVLDNNRAASDEKRAERSVRMEGVVLFRSQG